MSEQRCSLLQFHMMREEKDTETGVLSVPTRTGMIMLAVKFYLHLLHIVLGHCWHHYIVSPGTVGWNSH